MGKPRLIILIRHAQSEGNKNREIHQTTPDHRVKLTAEGKKQAFEAGRKLRSLLRPDDTLHFYTSPYRRTRETTEGILSSLTSSDPTPSPFPRQKIKVYEEPRLREQDFGNFQPDSAEMARMWQERANYGHFFYRIPNGESAADAYDRVSGLNESLWRSFGEDDFASVCVLVTHGLMTRVFLMKWYHWSVEYFEDLRNINHCEFIVMQKNRESAKYILKNQLRTWTQYKLDKAEAEAEAEASAAGGLDATGSPIPPRKRYGDTHHDHRHDGSPNAVRPQRQNTADLFREDGSSSLQQLEAALSRNHSARSMHRHEPPNPENPTSSSGHGASVHGSATAAAPDLPDGRPTFARDSQAPNSQAPASHDPDGPNPPTRDDDDDDDSADADDDDDDDDRLLDSRDVQSSIMPTTAPHLYMASAAKPSSPPAYRRKPKPYPPQQPFSPAHLAALRAGRDGGGSRSGTGSRAGSDSEGDEGDEDEDEDAAKTPMAGGESGGKKGVGVSEKGVEVSEQEQEESMRRFRPPRSMALALSGSLHSPGVEGVDALAEPLGDQSDMDDEEERNDGELQAKKGAETGFAGSVR